MVMRLATLLALAAVLCGGAWGDSLLSDMMRATKGMADAGVQSAQKAAGSALKGATDAASGATKMATNAASGAAKMATGTVQGVAGEAAKLARKMSDKEYYSLKHVLNIYKGCYLTYCMPNLLNATVKAECEAKKKNKCKEVDNYSLMDFLSYHLSQLMAKMAPSMALSTANSAAGAALKMG